MSLGIYIHIPFCRHKCNYCDFNSYVADSETRSVYVDALCAEIESADAPQSDVDTVYFGGGTPTVLHTEQLVRILDTVRRRFNLTDDCEISTECNPATIDRTGFEMLRKGGFNRISMGMQSANEEQLKILGRIHGFEDCRRCILDARDAGFDNLSLDLMSGIPEQNLDSWLASLKEAVALSPEHISCYALRVEEGTPFADMDLNLADDEQSREMYDRCVEYLKSCGYYRYEISNFAKSGFESRHNMKYWLCEDFVGFGAGAFSCAFDERYSNVTKTADYIKAINSGKTAVDNRIPLSRDDRMSEFVYLGLRMDRGISCLAFKKRFSADIYDIFCDELEKNIKRGTIIRTGDVLRIAPGFVYVSNSILADFVL